MGMDVYGKAPSSEKGEYFRNNVWYWRPLWEYCETVHCDITTACERGHENSGDGLDADDAEELGNRLLADIANGYAEEWRKGYCERLASLPTSECEWCVGTGVRTDEVGVEMGMPEKELSPDKAIVFGRTHGTCNACGGEGRVAHFATNYPFTVENLREFAEFLVASGGFEIW